MIAPVAPPRPYGSPGLTSEQLRAQMEAPGYQPPTVAGLNTPSTPGYVWGPGGQAMQGYSTSFNGQLTSGTPGMPTQQQVEGGMAPSLGAPVAPVQGSPAQALESVRNSVAQPVMPRTTMAPTSPGVPGAGMAPGPGQPPALQTGGPDYRGGAPAGVPDYNPSPRTPRPGFTTEVRDNPATTGTAPDGRPVIAPPVGAAPTTAIDPRNPSLRGREINFNVPAPVQVQPDQVRSTAIDSFNAQIPGMDAALEATVRNLGRSTSAMGRTGSGLYDREFRNIVAQEQGARQGLLGDMTMRAALADQSANLSAGLAHQPLALQYGFAGLGHQLGERGYQDSLAAEAMANEARRLGFLYQGGFGQNPTNAFLGAAAVNMQGSDRFGANAATLNDQVGGAIDLASQFIPRPAVGPYAPQPPIAPPRQLPTTYAGTGA